jgi:hypothetical protein
LYSKVVMLRRSSLGILLNFSDSEESANRNNPTL